MVGTQKGSAASEINLGRSVQMAQRLLEPSEFKCGVFQKWAVKPRTVYLFHKCKKYTVPGLACPELGTLFLKRRVMV